MDIKIKERGIGKVSTTDTFRTSTTFHTSDDTKAAFSKKAAPASEEDLVEFGKEDPSSGESLLISNIKSALSTANDAIDKISELKIRQLELAREGESLPSYTARHDQLEEENENLRNEITTIESTAKYNGNNVISQNATYNVTRQEGEIRNAIATGRISLTDDAGNVSLASSSASSSAISSYEGDIFGLHSSKAGYSSAEKKASNVIPAPKEEISEVKEDNPDALASVEEAQALAREVAEKLGAARGDEESVSRYIDAATSGLELDKVKDLLS